MASKVEAKTTSMMREGPDKSLASHLTSIALLAPLPLGDCFMSLPHPSSLSSIKSRALALLTRWKKHSYSILVVISQRKSPSLWLIWKVAKWRLDLIDYHLLTCSIEQPKTPRCLIPCSIIRFQSMSFSVDESKK